MGLELTGCPRAGPSLALVVVTSLPLALGAGALRARERGNNY